MKKSDVKKMNGIAYYSRKSFGKAESLGMNVKVTNEDSESWSVSPDIFEDEFYTHNQYNREIKMARTKIISDVLCAHENVGKVFTIHFKTKVDEKEALDKIEELYPNAGGILLSRDDFRERAKNALDDILHGKERTLIGYHYNSFDADGRLRVIDLEQPKVISDTGYDKRHRLVDVRTMDWLIIDNTKYVV